MPESLQYRIYELSRVNPEAAKEFANDDMRHNWNDYDQESKIDYRNRLNAACKENGVMS